LKKIAILIGIVVFVITMFIPITTTDLPVDEFGCIECFIDEEDGVCRAPLIDVCYIGQGTLGNYN